MKKGVFGNKEMPLDSIRGNVTGPVAPPEQPKEVTIKKAHGGFLVHTHPGKKGAYHDEHVATSMDSALDIMKGHMEGKSEPKNESD